MKSNIMTDLLLATALKMGFNVSNVPIKRANQINRNWKKNQYKEDKISRIEKAILKRKRKAILKQKQKEKSCQKKIAN